jgi:superfamily II DNA or RNA helicase
VTKPAFLTNEDGNTVAQSLADHLQWALNSYNSPLDVAIATAYFNPAGFALLAPQLREALEKGGSVRLLLGAEAVPAHRPPAVENIPALVDEAALTSRDHLGFSAEADNSAKAFCEWLQHDSVRARRLTSEFLHGKAYLVTTHATSAIVGSSNFTSAGLSRNLELNLGSYEEATVKRVAAWFDRIWEKAEDYKDQLLSLFSDRFEEYQPYDVYLRMLLARYEDELSERNTFQAAQLTRFQLDGADRAERILTKWGGVLIADGVGLGKTFVAGELLRRAEEERRQRTLVITPRAIQASWLRYKRMHGRLFDLITYDELVDWEKAALDGKVDRDTNRYALVVVDEAHYVRNDNQRNEALHKLLQGRPRKGLVLLTATPVNNRLRDLEQLLSFFVQSKGAFVEQGIVDTSDFFKSLENQDPDALTPEALFPILDEVAVRRTRAFVKDFYPDETIVVDGQKIQITFPEPEVHPLQYELRAKEFFRRLDHAVSCDVNCADHEHSSEWPTFTMARYNPSRYSKEVVSAAERLQREGNIAGLLLSGLLKRFESSVTAFEQTCRNMSATHRSFIKALDSGRVLVGRELARFQRAIDEGGDPNLCFSDNSEEEPESTDDYHVDALRAAVHADLELLESLVSAVAEMRDADDAKFNRLLERLHEIQDAASTADEKKVIIFSGFADTVDYLYDRIRTHTCGNSACVYVGDRVATATGSKNRRDIADATNRFAPVSTGHVELSEPDQDKRRGSVDLLITTDVLAEGVNLQQARHVINIDLPWNPMRIVQRHGRVSRIGSPHAVVILDCFYPDTDLEKLLDLGSRLRRKIAQANAAVGVEDAPLPDAATGGQVFADADPGTKETLELYRGDASLLVKADRGPGGTSGEEFRRELERALAKNLSERRRVLGFPRGIGSGKHAPVRDTTFVFCAAIDGKDRFVVVSGCDVVTTQTIKALHAARCLFDEPRVVSEEELTHAYDAWLVAREAILRDWEPLTDAQTHRLVIPAPLRTTADFLREHAPLPEDVGSVADLTERIEGAYSKRIERRFRDLLKEELAEDERIRRIAALVTELDLQPYKGSEPLRSVLPEDVELLAWMVLSPYPEDACEQTASSSRDVTPTT